MKKMFVGNAIQFLEQNGERKSAGISSKMSGKTGSEYTCTLDAASVKKAKDELSEKSDKDRDLAVQSLREWVLDQKDWMNCPTDYAFLLRFLRVRKFSQLESRDSIEKYWAIKDESKAIFRNMDTADSFVTEMLKDGIFICPKTYDKDGCRIIIGRAGRIDLDKLKKKWGRDNVYKLLFILVEWMLMDEKTQVHGFKFIWDMTNITMGHVTQMAGTDNNRMMAKFQNKAMPARIKGVWHYNEPPFMEAVTILFTPFMSKKLRDRMKFFGKNLANMYEHVGKHALPDEYLPDDYDGPSAGSEQQIIETMISELTSPEVRSHIQKVSSKEYFVDLKKKPHIPQNASFRKLDVD